MIVVAQLRALKELLALKLLRFPGPFCEMLLAAGAVFCAVRGLLLSE